MIAIIKVLHDKYGRLSYGLVVLLSLWRLICVPLMGSFEITAGKFSDAAAHLDAATATTLRTNDSLAAELEVQRRIAGASRRAGP